jgi:hypothetical protein
MHSGLAATEADQRESASAPFRSPEGNKTSTIDTITCKERGLTMSLQRFTFILLMSAAHLWAQVNATRTISGQVTDPGGAAIPNATVKVTEQNTGISESVRTGTDGYAITLYRFSNPACIQ